MNEIPIEQARKVLGNLARDAQKLGTVTTLTINGKPAARIVPIPQETAMTAITSAAQWANALDAEMSRTGQDAGTLISVGYSNGQILGITLDPNHPEADDERGVIVSMTNWIVGYDAQSGYWSAR